MKFLLDTHLLLWTAWEPKKLSNQAVSLLKEDSNEFIFSAASLWELAIKNSLGRSDLNGDPRLLRRALIDTGFVELAVTGDHGMATAQLPLLHRDPFDRLLLAQALVEGITLVTVDAQVATYEGSIIKV